MTSYTPVYNLARKRGATGLAQSMYRRQQQSRNRMYYSRPGLYRGRRTAQRAARARSFTQTRFRKRSVSGIGVTTQHDARLVYAKKNMPRFKKAAWRTFSKKVVAVGDKQLGTQQVVFNQQIDFGNTTPGDQINGDLALYPFVSTQSRFNDMSQISGLLAGAVTTPATGLNIEQSTKIYFQSAVLDVTIRNITQFRDSAGVLSPNSLGRMEVDVYELTMGEPSDESTTSYAQLRTSTGVFGQNATRTSPLGGGGGTTEIAPQLRGCTPFDLSYVLSHFKVKIWKKTKYQLANGDQFTYQMRDPRRHSCTYRELTSLNGFNKPGMTKFLWIVGRLAPGLTVGTAPNTWDERLTIGFTRKYSFKVQNYTEDRTAYL